MSILQKRLVSLKVFASCTLLSILTMYSTLVGAQCTTINGATSTATLGNQTWAGRLGMRFTSIVPITVSRLGAFDSGADGFVGSITVGIVDATGAVVVPSIAMTGLGDPLVGNFRMRSITPVVLPPGQYTVVSFGYSANDPNYNSNVPANLLATLNTGGLIVHDDSPWDSTAALGLPLSTHTAGGFHAGNFTFAAVQPLLTTTINGVVINTNNNGTDDTGSFRICSGPPSPNVTMGAFNAPGGSLVKVYQELVLVNATQTSGWCSGVAGSGCSAAPALFAGSTNTFTKVISTSPASVTVRFRAYYDLNNNNNIDANECPGDWAVYNVSFETQPPVITCPANRTVTALPTECSVIVNYAAPTTSDLPCLGAVSLVQTAGLPSGSAFPVGQTINRFLATDASGNTASCSFTVTVNDFAAPSLGCKPIQLSLDDDCEGEITPTMVLTGWESPGGPLLGCLDLYSINVVSPTGANLGNTMTINELGKTLKYTITNLNGFICWGDVSVEDKIAPTIVCRDVTVNCLTNLNTVNGIAVNDNCSAKAVLVNEVHEAFACDPAFIGKVTRTYIAEDKAGNKSLPCTQTIYLQRSSNSGITPPLANVTLRCSDVYKRDSKGLGYPSPDTTGVPMLGATRLYPLSQLNMVYCNSTIDYTDQLVADTKCKKRILRTWSITEWWCSTTVPIFVGMQLIDIIDDVAPRIPRLESITVTTQTRSCSAAVQLPKLSITDNCNDIYKVYVNATLDGEPSGYVGANGGLIELSVGVHSVTYSAFDVCGNSSTMTYIITVRDNTDPVAICDQFATVSLKTNGYTEVTASAIDDGSFDECGAVTLQVRRMEDPCSFGADTAWYDKVGFCCLDANTTRMVQLLVTDRGRNTNICMVSVNVQEKVNPSISCPGDLTVSDCLYTFDPSLAGANAAFGAAVITDNCPANNTLVHNLVNNRNQCGIGNVVRTFSVRAGTVTHGTCTQTITFENNDPFFINGRNSLDPDDDIIWPKDYIARGQCTFAGLLPETLPDSSSRPKISEDACDLVGVKYSDLVFPFTTNGACYKIIRTWTVIDWCQKDSFGLNPTWTYEQEIKVMDNNIPVITSSTAPVLKLTYDPECKDGDIVLTASATDCTPAAELKWRYTITRGGLTYKTGISNVASGTYPIGKYKIEYTVEDRCGNLATTGYDFEIRNAKAPTAVCKQGLAASLVLMDTDGNGTGDTPMTMLTPDFFDNKSSHVCGYPVTLSFSDDADDTIVVFGCADRGKQAIELWVTDINGNTSFCTTFVDVQDNNVPKLCPNNLGGNVAGKTIKENNDEIQDVTVVLKGSETNPTNTDINGQYAFPSMPLGGNYQVVPSKDGDDNNGVSTLDLVMIQRHILGITKLGSPYKIIAADINNSGKVTAADLTELRKLVLGIYTSFPDNTSWKFVDAGFTFADSSDPLSYPIAELYNIQNLANNMDVNFVGIKIGDVNDNAKGRNANSSTQKRSKNVFSVKDKNVVKGDIIEIPVYANNSQTIYGLQAQLNSTNMIIREVKESKLTIKSDDYIIPSIGSVSISFASPQGMAVTKGDAIFTIEAEILKSGKLSEMLQVAQKMEPEVYVGSDLETTSFGLEFRNQGNGDFVLLGNNPNPWNTNTSISFELPKDGMVSFKVKDYTGRNVISEINQHNAGTNVINLQRTDLGQSGVYIYELRFEDKVTTGKMILIE